jgi:hypothetical protein
MSPYCDSSPYDIERTIVRIKADSDDDIDGDRYRYATNIEQKATIP